MLKIRLNETNDNPMTKGIFHSIQGKGAFEWLTEDQTENLDVEYYWNRSGEKIISPLFDKLYEKQKSGDVDDALSLLSDILIRKYGDKWNHLYDALMNTTYNPIENYSSHEKESVSSRIEVTSEGDADTYAFNDSSSTPQAKATSTQTSQGSADDNVRVMEKSGNIGVTTNQQMLSSEIELRKWNFYISMMADIDETLCLSVY